MVSNVGVGSDRRHGNNGRGAGDETLDHLKVTLDSSEVAQTSNKKIGPKLKCEGEIRSFLSL